MHSRPAPFDSGVTDAVWSKLFIENPAALAIVEPSGQFSCVNDAFSLLLGRGQAQLVRQSWQSVTYVDDIAPDEDMVRCCLDGNSSGYSIEKRYLSPSGEHIWVRLWVRTVPMYGRVACFLVHAVRIEGANSLTQPAPIVMRPKLDLIDAIRDNPKQSIGVFCATIVAIAKFMADKESLEEKVKSLVDAEHRRIEELQKRNDLESEIRIRNQLKEK